MESDQVLHDTNENISLWFTNFTINKYSLSRYEERNHDKTFPLLKLLNSLFKDTKRFEIRLNFNGGKLSNAFQMSYTCDDTCFDAKNALLYEIQNTTCKFIIESNLYEIFYGDWITEFSNSEEKLITLFNQIRQKYLDKTTITEAVIYFQDDVVDLNFLSFFGKFNIIKLELPKNTIQSIKNTDFPYIPSLEVLNMTDGVTNFIEERALDNVSGLKVVDFSRNRLNRIPEPFYKHLFVNLTYLNLEENKPSDKNFYLSSHFRISSPSNLKILKLSKNLIEKGLEKGSFAYFPELRYLFLDHCNLTFIPKGTFDNLTSLFSLDLAGNYLESLPIDAFLTLYSIQYLNLSNNRFLNIPVQSLSVALNLTFLNFQGNLIGNLYNFSHSRLQYLNLRNNQIKEISNDLVDFPQLRHLDLSSNRISIFPKKILDRLLTIDFVNLSSNPFYCSPCNRYYLHLWLNATNYRDSHRFICSLPIVFKDIKVENFTSTFEDCLELIMATTTNIIISVVCSLCFISVISFILYYYRWYVRYFWFRLRKTFCTFKQEDKMFRYYKYDAFIAYYVSETQWVVEQLASQLESEKFGLKFCIHDRDFIAGRNVSENIIDSIEKSRKVVVLLSDKFMTSEWCMLEIHLAQHRLFEEKRDGIIIVKMENLTKKLIKKNISYLLKTRTHLEWPCTENLRSLFWDKLYKAIKS